MKKYLYILLFLITFFIFPLLSNVVEAAALKFDKNTFTGSVNDTFQAQIIVEAGTDNITGVDAYILYDPSLFDIADKQNQNTFFTKGTFFPGTSVSVLNGKVYIAGYVEDPGDSKTGTGVIGTLTFKMLKNGSGTLTYDCRENASGTSKIYKNDVNATDIIQCASNGKANITVGNGAGTSQQQTAPTPIPTTSTGTSSVVPTATPTPSPTAAPAAKVAATAPTATPMPSPTPKPPTQLPQAGVFDNVVKYSVPGAVLLFLGGVVRLLL